MKVRKLIEKLAEMDPDMEIAIVDGFNGGGTPRTINYGPIIWDPKKWPNATDNNDYEDLETPEGQPIVQMGYGMY